jgi:hypothetical protein
VALTAGDTRCYPARIVNEPAKAPATYEDVLAADPRARTLEVLRRTDDGWLLAGTWADGASVRAEPFDAIELDLAVLWADVAPAEPTK